MTCAVHKYPLVTVDEHEEYELTLPAHAAVLHVDAQFARFQLWAMVDLDQPVFQSRKFRIAGTGHKMHRPDHHYRHINSFQASGGVFHAFEVIDGTEQKPSAIVTRGRGPLGLD